MRKPGLGLLLMVLTLPLQPCGAAEIPLIGVDESGETVEIRLPREEYLYRFKAVMATVQAATGRALQRVAEKPGWMLRTVVVGATAGAEFGAGPVLKLKASPGFKMVFSNSKDPVLP